MPVEVLAQHLQWHLNDQDIRVTSSPCLKEVINAQRERTKTLAEMAARSKFFYVDELHYQKEQVEKHITSDVLPALKSTFEKFVQLQDWSKENLHGVIQQVCEETGLKIAKVAQPIRIIITGDTVSPSVDLTLAILGKDKSVERMKRFLHDLI